jgi:hypothetical protein
MQRQQIQRSLFALGLTALWFSPGCAEDGSTAQAPSSAPVAAATENGAVTPPMRGSNDDPKGEDASEDASFEFKPLTLNNLPGNSAAGGSDSSGGKGDKEKQIQTIINQLQPLQILLGQWRGTTRREYENFKAVDNHEWVWDLRTDPSNPALTIDSDKSPYLKKGRLSWDVQQKKFTLQATDAAGVARTYVGDFTEPVQEIVGSDDKLHKVFRLEFQQDESTAAGSEQWQLAIAQQENNRYLLEIGKRRGSADFARYDTVSTQREGTSFAVSDTDYAEKTCIISEGLGTTELTYKGRSYWVCCSGCKAAFEEEPEKWIARAALREKK